MRSILPREKSALLIVFLARSGTSYRGFMIHFPEHRRFCFALKAADAALGTQFYCSGMQHVVFRRNAALILAFSLVHHKLKSQYTFKSQNPVRKLCRRCACNEGELHLWMIEIATRKFFRKAYDYEC